MLVYWSMFLLPIIALLFPLRGDESVRRLSFFLVGIYLTLLIGFRFEVGTDWFTYLSYYERANGITLFNYLTSFNWRDPGYYVLNYLSASIGGGIYLVNLVCAGISTFGLITFSRRMPVSWLGLAIGVSYYLVVVSMNYNRQSAAIGLVMIALSESNRQRARRSLFFVTLAALFHLSALVMIPILALSYSGNRRSIVLLIAFGIVIFFGLIFAPQLAASWQSYVVMEKHSEGGFIRVIMNAMPALLLLAFREKLLLDEKQPRLWILMAIIALLFVPVVDLASTAVDRLALYLIPLQIFVFTRIHRLFIGSYLRTAVVLFVISYYGIVLWVWLNYAVHANDWLPYHFALFQDRML
jgi:hypothetical protein